MIAPETWNAAANPWILGEMVAGLIGTPSFMGRGEDIAALDVLELEPDTGVSTRI